MCAILATATALSVQTADAASATPETPAANDTSKSVTSISDHKTATPGQSVRLQARYSVRDVAGAPFRLVSTIINAPLAEGMTLTKGSKIILRGDDGTALADRKAEESPHLTVNYPNPNYKSPIKSFDFTVSYSVDIPATAKPGTQYVTTNEYGNSKVIWKESESGHIESKATYFPVADQVTVVERAVPLAQPAALGGAAVLALGGYLHVSRRRRQVC
ncbi:hypothetical protein ACFQ78_06935 [Streptomyces sp. NPDC056519]